MARRRVDNSSRARRGRRFDPFQPPARPPTGSYDSAFDAQERAAERGYGDLQLDAETGRRRDENDLSLGITGIGRDRDRSLSDLLLDLGRGRHDLGFQRQGLEIDFGRAREDLDIGHRRDTDDRTQGYRRLGLGQTQAGQAAGLGGSGFFAASAAARAANRGQEQGRADENFRISGARLGTDRGRAFQQLDLAGQRLEHDYGRASGRVREDATLAGSNLGLQFQRRGEDRDTQLGRAGRELGFLGQDLSEARFGQAAQTGYQAPERPRNEFTRRGVTYRRVQGGYLLPDGRIVSRGQLQSMYV